MKNNVLKSVWVMLFVLINQMAFATTYTTKQDGKWSDGSTWTGGVAPLDNGRPKDSIIINHKVTYKRWHTVSKYSIIINASGIVEGLIGSTLNLGDGLDVTNYGEIIAADFNTASGFNFFHNYGKIKVNGTFSHGNGIFINEAASNVYNPYVEVGKLHITNDASLFENHHYFKVLQNADIVGSASNRINSSTGVMYVAGNFNPGYVNFTNEGKLFIDGVINNGPMSGKGSVCTSDGSEVNYRGSGSTAYCDGTPIKDISLPIDLISFTAQKTNDVVELNWATASEENNDFFTIERSDDAENWDIVEMIQGAGNSNRLINYEYTDYMPLNGLSYYRLKQTDYNGDFSYSKIVFVDFNTEGREHIKAYPNPVINSVQLEIENSDIQELRVYNMLGQNVTAKVSIVKTGDSQFTVDMSNLPKGIYLVRTENALAKVYKQ